MWPFSKSPSITQRTLKDVLQDTNRLVASSEESDLCGFSPKKISSVLEQAIAAIDQKKEVDAATLRMHFAPTGPIQETAMSNRWSDEYLRLASEFDDQVRKA